MKKNQLEKLVFKEFLPVVYEDLEPHLLAELQRFRNELIALPAGTTPKELLSKFEESVNNFNNISDDENFENTIDTEEREGLCAALYKMGEIVGLDENTDYLDEWREW